MNDDLPNPDHLDGAQAFDCLRRLRIASDELRALAARDPELHVQIERILHDAWTGAGRFRDL